MSALPYWRIGQIEILRGNFTAAEAWLMEASTKFSATLMIKDEEIFHDIAVAVFQNKKVDRAHFYLSLALEINSRFPKGLNNYGCLLASSDPTKSVGFLKRAVELKPDHPIYIDNLWFMSQYIGDTETATSAKRLRDKLGLTNSGKRDCVWEFIPAP
jgi:Flp pilus assembly protein TadD